jgi:O-antigen ligase
MNFLSRIKTPLFKQIAFYAFLASGAYVILLWSPIILGKYIDHWNKIIIFLLPWVILWLAYSWQVLISKQYRLEIILMVSIIILGAVNAALSESARSISHMRIFLVTGIFVLWISMFLFTDRRRRQGFDWFCCGCLAIIISVEIIWWLIRDVGHDNVFHIFSLHAIPLGTLMILLSTGPINLLTSKAYKNRIAGGLIIFFSGLLIFLTHKRGTWLAVAAMLTMGLVWLTRRRKYLMLTLFLIMALLFAMQGRRLYARLDPNVPRYASILQRLELYNFALHIWETHPIMGTGLRPLDHGNYLDDYHQNNRNLTDFRQSVTKLQTFDNMYLTAFVELGSLMTLIYLFLVILIMARYARALWSSPGSATADWYRMLVIIGLALHSFSYDSLLLPPVNWLFHVQLGIMAGYYNANGEVGSVNHQSLITG